MKNPQNRFLALDVFRGMTVCLMIIVNTPGDKVNRFTQLVHTDWHGFTPADWVFPSFLFAVGNAMAFVMPKFLNSTPSAPSMSGFRRHSIFFNKIVKRTLIIFFLGFLMYWFPFMKWDATGQLIGKSISETRIMGVLQRIALAYFAGSLIVYFVEARRIWGVSIAILLGYWAILMLFGDASDPLSPDSDSRNGISQWLNIQTNAVYKLDHFLFGDNHLYKMNGTIPFDPEGLLSTLPAIVNVLAGYLAGKFIIEHGKTYEVLAKLLLVGFSLIWVAESWNWVFPINKKLWTSPFVLYTVGLDLGILAAIIYLIDFKNIKTGVNFFTVFGKNALFIYLFSEILAISLKFSRVTCEQSYFKWTYHVLCEPIGGKIGSLAFAVGFMLICWGVGYWLDKKKIYIKV
jgi:predicted acyltransferase